MNTNTAIMAGAWAPPARGMLLGGNAPAIAPATPYDDADDAGDVPCWEVNFPTPAYARPPSRDVLLAIATGNWKPFFDGLTRGAGGAPAFPEFECSAAAPF